MRTGMIYKITNTVNDKVYIGQTIQQLKRRWNQHCCYSKFSDVHLYRAMRAYGIDKFSIEPIEENIPQDKLNEREIYYIQYYDSYINGYNSTKGGDCGNFLETPVYQYDLRGNFINEFASANEAERVTGCLHQNILKTCKGIFSQTGGFFWSFNKEERVTVPLNKKYRQVAEVSETGDIIHVYPSVKSVADQYHAPSTHISRAIRRGYKFHGHHYIYLDGKNKMEVKNNGN